MYSPPYEKTEPIATWIFEVIGPLVFVIVAAVCVVRSIRRRELTVPTLLLISATSMSWQEFFGDWGAYLLYSDKFALMPWGSTMWTSPNKPWAVIPAYGWYYTAVFPAMLAMIAALRRRTGWGRLSSLLAVTFPIFYLWDLFIEGVAAGLGWWSYTTVYGPAILTDRGNFPVVYPLLLFVFYGIVATWVLDSRDDRGQFRHELIMRVNKLRPGWRRELGRALSWVVMMNVVYWVALEFPLVLIRELFLTGSTSVP